MRMEIFAFKEMDVGEMWIGKTLSTLGLQAKKGRQIPNGISKRFND